LGLHVNTRNRGGAEHAENGKDWVENQNQIL